MGIGAKKTEVSESFYSHVALGLLILMMCSVVSSTFFEFSPLASKSSTRINSASK